MSKKLKIIIPIIIVLLLIGGIAWGVYAFFANTPKNTYLKSEQQTAKMYKDYFNDRFENEVKFQEKMKDNSFLSSLELSADASDELTKNLDIPKSVVNASKIKMSYGYDPKKEKSMINLEPTLADTELGKFQLAADKDKHYFESPLFKGKYSIDNSDLLSTYAKLTGEDEETAKENGITNQQLNLNSIFSNAQTQQSDYEKIAEKYSELIVDKLKDDNFEKGKKEEIKINGEKHKVRPVTLTLSRADTKKITLAVLEEAKKGKDIKKLVEKKGTKKDFDKEIKKAIDNIKETKTDEFAKIQSKIYTEKHTIVKREITITDKENHKTKIKGTNTLEDDKLKVDYAINFDQDKYSYDESKYTIKGVSSKEKDNKYNDKYELAKKTEYDESKVTLDNQEKVDGTKRQDKGKIAFAMDKYSDENEITFENNIDSDVKNNTQKSTLNIGIKFAEEPINFILKSNTKLKTDIDFDASDAKDFNSLSSKDREKLEKEIEKNGGKMFESILKKTSK
ncbi:TPA: hypothetical protein RRM88_001373 [Staphylococcus argenteus]|uniref:DUF6583 family protein n=1 Tax=Staphylococcus argenteus TaxID=985002 RepID=UPI000506B6A1|nr:DUF6583 family protein [Staphylococcus argenteus]MBE2136615.1 hypothetical protein [Staphylococcus argenteus]MDT3004670.1 hypothetical protein [Staphylococcus argenteus]UPO21080.1 hypothetical protein M0D62_01355 [Staphylococcus argenteus]CDR64634.1 hypothetical protein ERS154949_01991 [Staphylococcus argenteus]HDY9445978.1 hypothetical protein [Staphylococcus argenteus]